MAVTMSVMLSQENNRKINVHLDRIADALEKHNELKEKELQILRTYIDFELQKHLHEKKIERIRTEM